jgi:single-strand DNA-binding protein
MGVNKVILIGNLGKDPVVQNFDNGVKKASFTLATSETFKDKNGEKSEHTEWHYIILWRGLAEVAEKYLKKGQTVYIEGKIHKNEYEKNGEKRTVYEIIGESMTMISRKDQSHKVEEKPNDPVDELPPDDLPF